MSYISAGGKTYKDYQEYCNSDDLELDDKFRKLLSGSRTPQTEDERLWLGNMRKIQSEGKVIEVPSGTF
ncbi:MAG: hypothetical protein MJZ17_08435 [Bacteroidales bacterium]|nr:hypothetical protein [Bacteroidales bacterium]